MRFPAERFASLADHAAWHGRHAFDLDDRARVEATPPAEGSCACCLSATRFVDGWCDCADPLDAGARAVLHAAVAEAGLCGWSRLRLMGVTGALAGRLGGLAGELAAGEAGQADVVIIDRLADAPARLLEVARRALVPGGCLLAALRFDAEARRGRPGVAGWDVLDMARAAGFSEAEVLRPWSRELGYVGGTLFLLRAVAG